MGNVGEGLVLQEYSKTDSSEVLFEKVFMALEVVFDFHSI